MNNKHTVCIVTSENQPLDHPEQKFNDYFVNIAVQLASSLPQRDNDFHHIGGSLMNSFFFEKITPLEVIYAKKLLRNKTSSGHDTIPTRIVISTIHSIAEILTHLINQSFNSGIFPSCLKLAKIILIIKSKENTDFTNFRPIPLLPGFSKTLEKILQKRLNSFLGKYNVITECQYGFRERHSTELAIIRLVHKIGQAAEQKKYTAGVFLDLSKAFDSIDHTILLYRLEKYGIRGKALDWIKSCLTDRYQYVEWNSKKSNKLKISLGVPQGSILGPLLFILYINDLPNVSILIDFVLFADDSNIFLSDHNIENLITKTNYEIAKVLRWFEQNKLTINKLKTHFIIFGPRQYLNYKEPYKIIVDNHLIEECKSTEFLGIVLDQKLTFKNHVLSVSSRNTK